MLPWWDVSISLPKQRHLLPHHGGDGAVGGGGPARSVDTGEGRVATCCLMLPGFMMTCLTSVTSVTSLTTVTTATSLRRAPHRSTKTPRFKMCISLREVTCEYQLMQVSSKDWKWLSLNFPFGFCVFVMADKYYRVDLQSKRVASVNPPYPRSIAKYWLGCKDEESPGTWGAEKK